MDQQNANRLPPFFEARTQAVFRIWIQEFEDQKFKKIYRRKKIWYYFDQKLQFTLSLGLHKGRSSYVHEKPSALKREHPALQNMKTFLVVLWVIFALLDPDPESGSSDLIESDPDADAPSLMSLKTSSEPGS